MEITKNTPGPWYNSLTGIREGGPNGKLIAQAWCGDTNESFGCHPAVGYSEMQANSALIADAPAILKSLINVLLRISTGDCDSQDGNRDISEAKSIIQKHLKL